MKTVGSEHQESQDMKTVLVVKTRITYKFLWRCVFFFFINSNLEKVLYFRKCIPRASIFCSVVLQADILSLEHFCTTQNTKFMSSSVVLNLRSMGLKGPQEGFFTAHGSGNGLA